MCKWSLSHVAVHQKLTQHCKSTMLLLLLSRFSRVRLCATPEMADHQARPSLGFSRQEHWSGLSFPSPMHESEKWKGSRSVVSDPQRPWTAAYHASPSVGFSRQEYWSGVSSPSWNLELVSIYHLISLYPKIRVLQGLLQGINSPCSFKFSMMGFNP